jgi:hypothetical protein
MSAELKTAAELKSLRTEVSELKALIKQLIDKSPTSPAPTPTKTRLAQPHAIIWGVLQKLTDDDVLDEVRSLKFEDAKDLSAGSRKVLEEVGEREFESLRELVDWLKSLTAVNFTKGALACRIMGKELVDELLSDVDRTPKKAKTTKTAVSSSAKSPAKQTDFVVLTKFTCAVLNKNKSGELFELITFLKQIFSQEAEEEQCKMMADYLGIEFPGGKGGPSGAMWVASTINNIIKVLREADAPSEAGTNFLRDFDSFIEIARKDMDSPSWTKEGGACATALLETFAFLKEE